MPIVGLPMLPPGRRLRLRGLYAGKCLVRVLDLSGGEERLPFSGRVIPDIFDPQDPYSTNQALAFFSSLSSYLGSAAGAGCSHTGRSDLERGIRQALDAREIVVISEAVEATLNYKVAPVAISRPRGTAWKVSGGADAFLIVRRKDLLPGERPMRDVEIREVIESLLSPGARPAAAEILGSLQGGSRDAASEKGAMRTRLAAAFRTGALVLVATKRNEGGGGDSADDASSESESDLAEAGHPLAPPRQHWIEFRVIDVTTGKAVPQVQLEVTLANASNQKSKTDGRGAIRFDDTTPGECTLRSAGRQVRLEDAYSFVETSVI